MIITEGNFWLGGVEPG